jgi:hypothetical protein
MPQNGMAVFSYQAPFSDLDPNMKKFPNTLRNPAVSLVADILKFYQTTF